MLLPVCLITLLLEMSVFSETLHNDGFNHFDTVFIPGTSWLYLPQAYLDLYKQQKAPIHTVHSSLKA